MFRFFKELFSDKDFLKRSWLIVLPVTIQEALNLFTNLVDNVMIGSLGEAEIGGVGLASRVFFVVILVVFGAGSGMSVLSAQYWGNNDIPNIRKVVGIGAVLSVAFSVIFGSFCYFMPEVAMSIFTDSPNLIKTGAVYLRISSLSWVILAIKNTLAKGLHSMDVVMPGMYISVVAIATNIFFNWVMIFGKLGCPSMGVAGAAYATVIARAVELILTVLYLKVSKSPLWCSIRLYFGWQKELVSQFFKRGAIVALNDTLWGVGMCLHSITYGRMGEAAAAAMSIVNIMGDIEIVGLLGLATAAAVILGNELGAGHLEKAKTYAQYYQALGLMVGVLICIITLVVRKPVISMYNISPEAQRMTDVTLFVTAISLLWRADNNVNIVGILRAGGDTKACAFIDLVFLWFVAIPAVIIGGLVLHWPLWAVYLVQQSDEFLKLFAGFFRIGQGKWIKNLNVELNTQV